MIAATTPAACAIDEGTVWKEITRVARTMVHDGRLDPERAARVRTRLRGKNGQDRCYEVRAEPLLHAGTGGPVMMLAIERVDEVAPEPERLEDLFGFTPRQAQVAVLVAENLTNKQIAARLGIRPSTTRNHLEMVMLRLGVHRREDVRDRVLGAIAEDEPVLHVGMA